MKKRRILLTAIALLSISLFVVQCSKDETAAKLSKLSGTISVSASNAADGAIVSLSSEPNAANVIARTITDANGQYSVMGLENGTYYLNATYEPSNNNNLKSTGTVVLTGKEVEVVVSGDMTKDVTMEGMKSDGTDKVNIDDQWVYDNTHSTIGFEFPYDAFNAVFKGNFSSAGLDVFEFDEANPTATKIKAWVDITSVETGAASGFCGHGRDGITGCIQGTFGLDLAPADTVMVYCEDGTERTGYPNTTLEAYDLWGDGSATTYEKQSSVVGKTGVATFEATSVLPYGTGYMATGDFSFAGNKKVVNMYFSYVKGYAKTDNTKTYCSFYGWFDFAAEADYGIISGHVGDSDVKVVLSIQLNKAL